MGRTDAEAPIIWPPDAKNWPTGKDPDAGEDRRQEQWVTEGGMAGWHPQLSGQECEQSVGDGGGQGNLECSGPWGHKGLDATEWLTNSYNLFSLLELFVVLNEEVQKKEPPKPKNHQNKK